MIVIDEKKLRRIVREEAELVFQRKIVREEVEAALHRKIQIERGPRQNGDPEKTVKEEDWNIIDFIAIYLPRLEGALRGVQEDTSKTANRVLLDFGPKIDILGKTLLAMENVVTGLAEFSDTVKRIRLATGFMDQPPSLPERIVNNESDS